MNGLLYAGIVPLNDFVRKAHHNPCGPFGWRENNKRRISTRCRNEEITKTRGGESPFRESPDFSSDSPQFFGFEWKELCRR